jgi:hypothetical protein
MKYKVGDYVKIRKGLKMGEYYGVFLFNEEGMGHKRGKITRINYVGHDCYGIIDDTELSGLFSWTDEMIQRKATEKEIVRYKEEKLLEEL